MSSIALGSPPARRGLHLALLAAACGALLLIWAARSFYSPTSPEPAVEQLARRYVSLALTLGKLFPAELDSYFGPADLAPVADKPSLPMLRADLGDLATELRERTVATDPRAVSLAARVDRLRALVDTIGPGSHPSFDEEAQRLYGLPTPRLDEAGFAEARARLERLLPGEGPLAQRVEAFRTRFVIPADRRAIVFQRALGECRRRTLAHWSLPRAERLDIEWTRAVDAAWQRYRGAYRSALQINPDAVAFLGSAIDVACHEAYPGHHTQFMLAEANAPAGGPRVEDRIVLTRSPAAVLREGAADFGVALAFPAFERLAFERDVLMPLAGLPQIEAAHFEEVRGLLDRLAPAAYPILRDYRDGKLDGAAASAALSRDALVASPQSLLAFTDAMGAYVAGYTAVREQVRQWVMMPGAGDPWRRLGTLVTNAGDASLATLSAPRAQSGTR